jgi:hypothetical protein
MKTFQAVIYLLKTLVEALRYISGQINAIEFNTRLNKIEKAVNRAENGPTINDRMEGGRDVEDNFNRHN